MPSYEEVLKNAPKGVEVSREDGNIDISFRAGGFGGLATSLLIITLLVGIVFLIDFSGERWMCPGKTGMHPCSVFDYGLMMLLLLVSPFCTYMSIRNMMTKFVIRIDPITGDFSMFKKMSSGETPHVKFSRNQAVCEVLNISGSSHNENHRMTRFSVYANTEDQANKKEAFFVPGKSPEMCEWLNSLILAITYNK